MLSYDSKGFLAEDEYTLMLMPKSAALFTTGNGYMGVRGSLEEFGSARVQGAFIRGLIDEIVEVMEPFPDNEYMQKYYFDEQELKDFEKQDSCINFADFLTVRFTVGGSTFYPWEGKILKWKRYLDVTRAALVREVVWEDCRGRRTRFTFERFASYADVHLYVMKCSAYPVNHSERVEIVSGIDKKVRTGGQRVICEREQKLNGSDVYYSLTAGAKYGYGAAMSAHSEFYAQSAPQISEYDRDGVIGTRAVFADTAKGVTLVKTIWVNTSRDSDGQSDLPLSAIKKYAGKSYEELLDEHLAVYKPLFARFDARIEGDREADAALRFSDYHTVISACLTDSVHGLSAKSLSGERYNQFVWWDAEIYQYPAFRFALPEAVKLFLGYRYRQLPDARKNAREQGYRGARFPFVASVDGKEKVWKYARHPHLQVHITADIGYAVVAYFHATDDVAYMREQGYELLADIMRYWVSRATETDGRYEIKRVTGTDEHHPYVDNDAYTNYTVKYVFDCALTAFANDEASEKFLSRAEREEMERFAQKLYLPRDEFGMIPQFDGYFSLSRTLKTVGSGTGKNFQMKQAGLYHLSQVIKQPDVMLLYSYINAPMEREHYAANWDYYEKMCESSSSLSYPPHAICSADNGRMLSFYDYFMQTVKVDTDDIFGCAWQGIHAGCAAGGYYALLRGLIGVTTDGAGLHISPVRMPMWKKVAVPFVYKGSKVKCVLCGDELTVSVEGEPLCAEVNGQKYVIRSKKRFAAKTERA